MNAKPEIRLNKEDSAQWFANTGFQKVVSTEAQVLADSLGETVRVYDAFSRLVAMIAVTGNRCCD